MSSIRTRTQEKEHITNLVRENRLKDNKEHIVLVLDDATKIKDNARAWVDKRNEYYKKLLPESSPKTNFQPYSLMEAKKSNQPLLASINPNAILYLYCHGSTDNSSIIAPEDAKIWIKNFNPDINLKISEHSPKDLLQFLINQKLSKDHKVLKIAACYSDKFALGLSQITANEFPMLQIYGYKGELIVGKGQCGGNIAGLFPDDGTGLLSKNGNAHTLNMAAFATDPDNLVKYRAKNHRVGFLKGKELTNTPASEEKNDVHKETNQEAVQAEKAIEPASINSSIIKPIQHTKRESILITSLLQSLEKKKNIKSTQEEATLKIESKSPNLASKAETASNTTEINKNDTEKDQATLQETSEENENKHYSPKP